MPNKKLHLDIITQEKQLYSGEIDKVSAPAVLGEAQILPGHIPLFTRLDDGILKIWQKDSYRELAIVGGFMDVAPGDKVTIMADSAILAESANEAKALVAKEKAEAALKEKVSEIQFKTVEASLRKALMELKVARRKSSSQLPS
jgi:F-type H+-transporting ATPase subunit epsilon